MDIVKLLAGSHEMEPDVRTRGGYTPLMLAALGKKHEVYDLLVNAYKADESLRDFSGGTSGLIPGGSLPDHSRGHII